MSTSSPVETCQVCRRGKVEKLFLLNCASCGNSWHHRCLNPKMPDAELFRRVTIALEEKKRNPSAGKVYFLCASCTKAKNKVPKSNPDLLARPSALALRTDAGPSNPRSRNPQQLNAVQLPKSEPKPTSISNSNNISIVIDDDKDEIEVIERPKPKAKTDKAPAPYVSTSITPSIQPLLDTETTLISSKTSTALPQPQLDSEGVRRRTLELPLATSEAKFPKRENSPSIFPPSEHRNASASLPSNSPPSVAMALPIPSRSGPAAGTVRKKTIFQKTATPVGKLESGNHKSMSISSFKHESPTSPGSVSATTESQRAAGRSEGVMVIDDPVDFLYEASPKARIPTSTKYLPVHADRPRPSILTRNPVPSTSSTGLVSGVSGLTVQDRDEAQERTALATRSTLGPPPAKNPDNPQLIENAHMLGLEQPSTTSQSMSTTPQIQIKTGTKSLVQPRHTPHPALLPYWINARHTNDVTKPDVWTLASTGHLLTNRARRRAYTPSYPALESDIPPPITASKRRKFIAVPLKQELSSLPSLSQLSREDLEVLGRRPPSPMYFKVGEWIREKKDAMVLEDGGFD